MGTNRLNDAGHRPLKAAGLMVGRGAGKNGNTAQVDEIYNQMNIPNFKICVNQAPTQFTEFGVCSDSRLICFDFEDM